jgi:hypothetical protein
MSIRPSVTHGGFNTVVAVNYSTNLSLEPASYAEQAISSDDRAADTCRFSNP